MFSKERPVLLSISVILAAVVLLTTGYVTAGFVNISLLDQLSPTRTNSDPYKNLDDENIVEMFKALDWKVVNITSDRRYVERVVRSPTVVKAVLDIFQSISEHHDFRVAAFIAELPTPLIRKTAMVWAVSMQDTNQQINGFTLLARMPPDGASQALAIEQIFVQQDEKLLERIVWSLRREDIPHPALAERIADRLAVLTTRTFAPLRAASIQRLAEWDRRGKNLDARLIALLSDPDISVRIAAVGAVSIHSMGTSALKAKLLEIAGDKSQDQFLRDVAIKNLQEFHFDEAEFSIYKKIDKSLSALRKITP